MMIGNGWLYCLNNYNVSNFYCFSGITLRVFCINKDLAAYSATSCHHFFFYIGDWQLLKYLWVYSTSLENRCKYSTMFWGHYYITQVRTIAITKGQVCLL